MFVGLPCIGARPISLTSQTVGYVNKSGKKITPS